MDISYPRLCKIREIINKYDPEEYDCAPPDEYYDLVDKIVEKIETADVENVKKVILDTFRYMVDTVESNEQFISKLYNIAIEISDCLNEGCWKEKILENKYSYNKKPAVVKYIGKEENNKFSYGTLYEAYFWNIGRGNEIVCM